MKNLEILDVNLSEGEYVDTKVVKDTIWLHHTEGCHRPDWRVRAWDRDRSSNGKRWRIATAFVIGGKSTRNNDTTWDGKIVRAFSEDLWAYHLAAKRKYKVNLDPKSIGIEICNYGHLTQGRDGQFYTSVNSVIPHQDVYENSDVFRGYTYWHKYTDSQLDNARNLLLFLSDKFEIDLKFGLNEMLQRKRPPIPIGLESDVAALQQWLNENSYLGSNLQPLTVDGQLGPLTKGALDKAKEHPFEIQDSSLYGQGGLWTHSNCRQDKTNCHPQPELLEMLKSL
jgi:hypothetical protein